MARYCWHIPDFAPPWHARPGAIAAGSGCTLAAESSGKPPRWAPSPLATNRVTATLRAGYLANDGARGPAFVAAGGPGDTLRPPRGASNRPIAIAYTRVQQIGLGCDTGTMRGSLRRVPSRPLYERLAMR